MEYPVYCTLIWCSDLIDRVKSLDEVDRQVTASVENLLRSWAVITGRLKCMVELDNDENSKTEHQLQWHRGRVEIGWILGSLRGNSF